ncbi:MAG: cytochrome C [Desulfuromonadales bacterium]|jgi:c(7)-type cytochrome triheme protein|nr:cytochrome C [Desulfuromonadales bacterium]
MRTLLLLIISIILTAGLALAVPPGKSLKFSNSPMGTVTFDGKLHKDAGNSCKDCHNKDMFPKMKQGTVKITMNEIYAGKYCGVCHNGQRAFEAKTSCNRCHVKQ